MHRVCCQVNAILQLLVYRVFYDKSHRGSKWNMTSCERSCLISFALIPLSRSEREGSKKFIMKKNMSPVGFEPKPDTLRQVKQRSRPFRHWLDIGWNIYSLKCTKSWFMNTNRHLHWNKNCRVSLRVSSNTHAIIINSTRVFTLWFYQFLSQFPVKY